MVVVRIVEDIFPTGEDDVIRYFATELVQKFDLSESSNGPCQTRFYGLTINQFDDYTCEIHGNGKRKFLSSYSLSLLRRR